MKNVVKNVLGSLVVANTCFFLLLAVLHQLPNDPKSAIFVDFWGRFTVYSLWFIGFVLYRKYLSVNTFARRLVLLLVSANIPLFLGLAYFDKITMNENSIVFVDFWGRITVYSFWVLCYEGYLWFMSKDSDAEALDSKGRQVLRNQYV